jgi:hypothetical protein
MDYGSVTAATVHRVVDLVAVQGGGTGTHYGTGFWVLWVGITLFLCLLYMGVYLGIRCYRVGSGRRRTAETSDLPSPPAVGSAGSVGVGAHDR